MFHLFYCVLLDLISTSVLFVDWPSIAKLKPSRRFVCALAHLVTLNHAWIHAMKETNRRTTGEALDFSVIFRLDCFFLKFLPVS